MDKKTQTIKCKAHKFCIRISEPYDYNAFSLNCHLIRSRLKNRNHRLESFILDNLDDSAFSLSDQTFFEFFRVFRIINNQKSRISLAMTVHIDRLVKGTKMPHVNKLLRKVANSRSPKSINFLINVVVVNTDITRIQERENVRNNLAIFNNIHLILDKPFPLADLEMFRVNEIKALDYPPTKLEDISIMTHFKTLEAMAVSTHMFKRYLPDMEEVLMSIPTNSAFQNLKIFKLYFRSKLGFTIETEEEKDKFENFLPDLFLAISKLPKLEEFAFVMDFYVPEGYEGPIYNEDRKQRDFARFGEKIKSLMSQDPNYIPFPTIKNIEIEMNSNYLTIIAFMLEQMVRLENLNQLKFKLNIGKTGNPLNFRRIFNCCTNLTELSLRLKYTVEPPEIPIDLLEIAGEIARMQKLESLSLYIHEGRPISIVDDELYLKIFRLLKSMDHLKNLHVGLAPNQLNAHDYLNLLKLSHGLEDLEVSVNLKDLKAIEKLVMKAKSYHPKLHNLALVLPIKKGRLIEDKKSKLFESLRLNYSRPLQML